MSSICMVENDRLLSDYLSVIGIDVGHEQRDLLLQHLELVIKKNEVMNLTRIVDPQQAIIRHVIDSLLLTKVTAKLELSEETHFVDIGTGAGFPGVPLGVVSRWKGTLIDSVGKKALAVQEFIEELGLANRLEARPVRAEDLAREQYESHDLVVARAVADLGALVEYASPLLAQGGYMVVSKARIEEGELTRGSKTAHLTGMSFVSRETFELPDGEGHREILVYQRKGNSKRKLPRRAGDAVNKPLVR